MSESVDGGPAAAGAIRLASFPEPGVAIVFGATGGIGAALVEAIRASGRFTDVLGFSRSTSPSIDLLDEDSLERAAVLAAESAGDEDPLTFNVHRSAPQATLG